MNVALAEYATKREILDLLSVRALGADRFDVALMRACHPLDATDNHGTAHRLMHDFITSLEERARSGPRCRIRQHVVANALFVFRADGDVFVESYRTRAGDRADAELAHTCYHEGATERHGMFDGLTTEFIDVVSFMRPKPGTPIKIMAHVVTNILIEFESETRAFVEAYLIGTS